MRLLEVGADKTRREFLEQDENLSGEIAIGSGELRSFSYLSNMLASFWEKYPAIHIDVHSGNADNIKERIEKGLLDIGMLLEPVDIGKYEFLRLPGTETWSILIHNDSSLASKDSIEPHDLIGQPLFIPNRAALQSPILNWFGDIYDSLDIAGRYNLIYNIAVMVQCKKGAAFCLKLDAAYENLTFVPLSPKIEATTLLVWKKNQMQSRVTLTFLEYVRNALQA